MKFIQTIIVSTVLLAPPESLLAQTDSESTVTGILEQVAASFESGELDTLDEVFAEGRGVHIIEGAGVNHGWAEYRDDHLIPELEVFENFSYRIFAIEPQLRGDLAFTAFRYELAADIEGDHIDIEGRGTAVLEYTQDRWQIVHWHTSGRRRQ